MNEITLLGHSAPVGTLKIEPTDDGTQVRLSVTTGGESELTLTLNLSLRDAEAVSGMFSDAIAEVSDTIEALADEVHATPRPPNPTEEAADPPEVGLPF